jgi:hypothetical protein
VYLAMLQTLRSSLDAQLTTEHGSRLAFKLGRNLDLFTISQPFANLAAKRPFSEPSTPAPSLGSFQTGSDCGKGAVRRFVAEHCGSLGEKGQNSLWAL